MKYSFLSKKSIRNFILSLSLVTNFSAVYSQNGLVDYVNPLIDSHKSRWFFFSSACRPFGMVSLSPDTWPLGSWNSGYLYDSTSIRCFSHIHCWEISGIPVMPTTGVVKGQLGFEANKSKFSHDKEVVKAGYHKVVLEDYNITVELTSSCRVGFHRFTFPKGQSGNILFDVGAELGQGKMDSAAIRKLSDTELAGYAIMSGMEWRRKKPCTVYFVAQFNRPFSQFGGWKKQLSDKNQTKVILTDINEIHGVEAGGYVTFNDAAKVPVLLKVAISFVSEEQARLNLNSELAIWDFDKVVKASYDEWNRELGRIEVEGGTNEQKIKFYTDLWHALLGRHIYSDVNGKYTDNTGPKPLVKQVTLDENGKPVFNMHNSDGFWGSEFCLNTLWALAYPDVMNDFAATLTEYYKNGGLIARGPSGGNYTFVMNGDQAISLITSAYNKGIRNFDTDAAYAGCLKNSEIGGIRSHAGYETTVNTYMDCYIARGYVPEGIQGIGWDKDGCSLTLYFAYDDWCMAQFAKGMGKIVDYEKYYKRSFNYRNVFDSTVGWMRPRELDGTWIKDFSPIAKGGGTRGFSEANSAIFTYYVPHNIPDLIKLLGGNEAFIAKLYKQFELAAPNRFMTPHGFHGENWLDFENEPSLHMAHLFSYAGAPWLTQYWLRRVKEAAFSNITPYGGYNGDEDQGMLGSFGVLTSIGLFDVEGGANADPHYEITTPVFDKVIIHLNNQYYKGKSFVIKTVNNGPKNIYIQSAKLNNKDLNSFRIPHSAFVNGGELELVLGDKTSKWAVDITK